MKYQLSIIIPVLGEGPIINQTIAHLCHLKYCQHVELIVVDGNPEKETINAIIDTRVKKAVSKRGRGAQMNTGAHRAAGDILLFLHADTRLAYDAIERILKVMHHGHVVGGAFDLGIQSKKAVFRIIEKTVFVRSRITKIPCGDQAIFLRRKVFHQLEGFREIPIMEDVDLMRRLKKQGAKIAMISCKVQTSPRRWEKEGILYCTFRNWVLMTLFMAGVAPEKLVRFYQ